MQGTLKDLETIAAQQHGYITLSDVERLSVQASDLKEMMEQSILEEIPYWGLYRFEKFEWTNLCSYMEAVLWPQNQRGVISHETALALYELSDVNPDKIHVCVQPGCERDRAAPGLLRLHYENLAIDDTTEIHHIPIVTPQKAILQCYETFLGPALLAQAIKDGYKNHLFNKTAAIRLANHVCLPRSILNE